MPRPRREPGERYLPEKTSHWWGEHRSRYRFAAEQARGQAVLDLACGPGYGSRILLDAGAGFVVAADVSLEAVREARRVADGTMRAGVCVIDGTRLAFRSGSIGLVASFETLEHVERSGLFLDEIRRVLVPDGLLILSTPNALLTEPVDGRPKNPFHVHEFEPDELRASLAARFSEVHIMGQRVPPSFRFTPFVELRRDMPRDIRTRLAFLSWRVQHRLPFAIKDRLSRAIHGHSFYPGEDDWQFVDHDVDKSHVLVAVCRP
ncbi:MAG: class I SAM-dependent methyltransferase [Actinomycetota bacterium]